MTTTTTAPVDNGVNVEALLGAREAFADAPEIAQFQWRSTVTWVNGTHSRSDVETFYGFGEEQTHQHDVRLRHRPPAAVRRRRTTASRRWSTCWSPSGGCLTAGIAAVAQQRGIQLRSVQATVAAEMDLHGILGADPDVRNGFSGVRVDYRDRRRRDAGGDRGAGRAVAEALGGLRHPDQPDRRHGHA